MTNSPRSAPRAGTRPGTVLITGGAGYIGSHLTRDFLDLGWRVRVLERFLYGRQGLAGLQDHPRLEIMTGDIRDPAAVGMALKGADAVVALAALVGDAACDHEPAQTEAINVDATALLAEACLAGGVRRLVFASSCSVYGGAGDHILDEQSPVSPLSRYGWTRVRSEETLRRYAGGLDVVVLRLATVFGLSPRMRLDLLVNTFAAQAYFRGRIRVFGGRQWRPNVHVRDAAHAFLSAVRAPAAAVAGQVFNVGSDAANHTIVDVAEMVRQALPATEVEVLEGMTDERNYRVAFDKITRVMGFGPRFDVMAGVTEVIDACRKRVIPALDDVRYHNANCLRAHGFAGAPDGHAEAVPA
jgi:nucleoside-diphosphate-sugar epimerase